jgi:hypothetical protein
LAVVFSGGLVVGFGGIKLVFEGAEVNSFSVDADSGPPSIHIFCKVDAFVFRAGVGFEFSSVPDVLGVGYGSEVCLSVVEAVVVDVVAEHAMGDVDDEMVHVGVFAGLFFSVGQRADGIKGVYVFLGVPFVFHQAVIVLGVNDGEFAPGEGDFSKRVAEADSPIEKENED